MKKPIIYIVNGENLNTIRKDWLEAFNSQDFSESWIIEYSSLTKDKVNFINDNYSAIIIRETQFGNNDSYEFLSQFNIPVFSQLEFPYLYLNNLKKDRIYLTDKSYLHLFPKAEIQFDFIRHTSIDYIPSQKEFDVLFIGTMGLRSFPKNVKIIDQANKYSYMNRYINNFNTTDEIFKDLGKNFLRYRFFKWRNSLMAVKKVEWFLQHQIRSHRRNKILQELERLSDMGYKVAFVTNEKAKLFLPHSVLSKFKIFYDLSLNDELPKLAAQSSLVIVQTPMHHSLINERFLLAIENGAIPLVEAYPQYQEIYKGYNNKLFFDYTENNLSEKVSVLLKDRINLNQTYDELKNRSMEILSKEKYVNWMVNLVKKYSLTNENK